MSEKKWYISLTCKGANAFHPDGQRLNLIERTVNIGESADCDVRYENGDFTPEYYASILRNEDGKSWRLVKRSQHVGVSIAGKGAIGYACQLADGDIIQFDDQPMALLFHAHHDEYYREDDTRKSIWPRMAVIAACIIAAAAGFIYALNNEQPINEQDVAPLEESIYQIRVDSVQQLLVTGGHEELLRPSKVLEEAAPVGTAFLTTDGIMVTARHCVEYWLGTQLDLTTDVSTLSDDDIVKWAIETETYNQTHEPGDSLMIMRVHFSIYDFTGEKRYAFSSTDDHVHINTAHDAVFLLGDFSEEYYWRSIRPYFVEREMELGDILWIDGFDEKGKVKLASSEDVKKLHNGSRLMVCGYPMTGIGDNSFTSTSGSIRRESKANSENLFFESNINHGYSGGPVLIKTSGGIAAAGVVSRVDSVSSGLYKWAVPVTEIKLTKGGVNNE